MKQYRSGTPSEGRKSNTGTLQRRSLWSLQWEVGFYRRSLWPEWKWILDPLIGRGGKSFHKRKPMNSGLQIVMMYVNPRKIKMEPQNCWFGSMFFFFFKEVFSSFKMLVFQSVPRFDVEFSEHGSFVEMGSTGGGVIFDGWTLFGPPFPNKHNHQKGVNAFLGSEKTFHVIMVAIISCSTCFLPVWTLQWWWLCGMSFW